MAGRRFSGRIIGLGTGRIRSQPLRQLPVLLKRYEVLKKREGPNSNIYKCRDSKTGRLVAVKEITSKHGIADLDADRQRQKNLVKREYAVGKNFDHPNLPSYYDLQETQEGSIVMVREWVEGHSLRDFVKAGNRFTDEQVYRIISDVLDAVAHLHSFNPPVIHRDISPGNVIMDVRDNAISSVKLIDIAVDRPKRSEASMGTSNVGTYGFFAQEILYGEAMVQSDLFSVGAVMYYLVSGGNDASDIYDSLKSEYMTHQIDDERIRDFLDSALKTKVQERYSNAHEMAAALDRCYGRKTRSRKSRKASAGERTEHGETAIVLRNASWAGRHLPTFLEWKKTIKFLFAPGPETRIERQTRKLLRRVNTTDPESVERTSGSIRVMLSNPEYGHVALETVRHCLSHRKAKMRANAVHVLVKVGYVKDSPAVIEIFGRILSADTGKVRSEAGRALLHAAQYEETRDAAWSELLKALSHKSESWKKLAFVRDVGMAAKDEAEFIPPMLWLLETALANEDKVIRKQAADDLAEMKDALKEKPGLTHSVGGLNQALQVEDMHAQATAAELLAEAAKESDITMAVPNLLAPLHTLDFRTDDSYAKLGFDLEELHRVFDLNVPPPPKDPTHDLRKKAVTALANALSNPKSHGSTMDKLAEAVRSDNEILCCNALNALAEAAKTADITPAFDIVIDRVSHPSPAVRSDAIEVFEKAAAGENVPKEIQNAIPTLSHVVSGKNGIGARSAASALAKIGRTYPIAAAKKNLIKALESDDEPLKSNAAEALAEEAKRSDITDAIPQLARDMADGNELKYDVVHALSNAAETSDIRPATESLGSALFLDESPFQLPSPEGHEKTLMEAAKQEAERALIKAAERFDLSPAINGPISKGLSDPKENNRKKAAAILIKLAGSKMNGQAATAALAGMLSHENPKYRAEAAEGLEAVSENTGLANCTGAVAKALADDDYRVRRHASAALAKSAGKTDIGPAIEGLESLVSDYDGETRSNALKALDSLLSHQDSGTRSRALDRLNNALSDGKARREALNILTRATIEKRIEYENPQPLLDAAFEEKDSKKLRALKDFYVGPYVGGKFPERVRKILSIVLRYRRRLRKLS